VLFAESDAVQIVKEIATLLSLVVTVVGVPLVAFWMSRMKAAADKAAVATATLTDKVEVIHKATNSLVEQVVGAEKAASRAEGKQEERVEQHARAALVAEGTAAGKAEVSKPPAVVGVEPPP
jgi:outer membrane murein-binding lipoprotein Lpp